MTKRLQSSSGYVKAFAFLLLAFSIAANGNPLTVYSKLNRLDGKPALIEYGIESISTTRRIVVPWCGTSSLFNLRNTTKEDEQLLTKCYDQSFVCTSKRNIADHEISDRVSRDRAKVSRQAALLHLLELTDTSTGGTCSCLLKGNVGHKKNCHCNTAKLLASLLKTLRSSESKENAFADFLTKIDNQTKHSLFQVVAKELQRAKRARKVERIRLGRMRRKMLHRRSFVKMHPRAAFDGKQMMSF